MVRVLKITSGLMGVLLLVMVGVMGAGRYGKDGVQRILIKTGTIEAGKRLAFVVPGMKHVQYLTSSYWAIESIHWSDNGEYVYFVAHDGKTPLKGFSAGMLYRVLQSGGKTESIAGPMRSFDFSLTLDENWVVYVHNNNERLPEIFRVRSNGQEQLSLTSTLQGNLVTDDYHLPFVTSPNSDWIAVNVTDDKGSLDVWRVNLHTGDSQNLTSRIPYSVQIHDWLYGQDGMIVAVGSKLYYLHKDGEVLTRLFENPTEFEEEIVRWLPEEQLLIVGSPHHEQLIGLRWGYKIPIWMHPDTYLYWRSPIGDKLILEGRNSVASVHLDGSGYQVIYPHDGTVRLRGLSPNGEWLYFTNYSDEGVDDYSLRRLQVSTGFIEQVYPTWVGFGDTARWSPDGEWFILNIDSGPESVLYKVSPDGSQMEPLTNKKYLAYFEAWTPLFSSKWHPSILAAVAVTLIFVHPLISRIRLQQRGRV